MTRKMIVPGYSEGDKRFLATMQRALAWSESHPDGLIRFDWCSEVPAADFRREYRKMIDAAINRRGGIHYSRGRKDCHEYQTALMRDAITIRHYRKHGHFSQFGRPLMREGRRAAPDLAA